MSHSLRFSHPLPLLYRKSTKNSRANCEEKGSIPKLRTKQRPHKKRLRTRLAHSPCSLRAKNLKAPGAVAALATGEHLHSSNHWHPLSSSRTGIGATGCSSTRGVLARPAAARGADWTGGAGKGGPSTPLGLPTPGKCEVSQESSEDRKGGGGERASLHLGGRPFSR